MKNIKIISLSLLGLLLIISNLNRLPLVNANQLQSSPIGYESSLNKDGLKNATLGSCVKPYESLSVRGNIHLNVKLDNIMYNPSGSINIEGQIVNNNNYPMPGLKIRAKVAKIDVEGVNKVVKIVDEFVLKDNINLGSLGQQEINEIYNLPLQATEGDYELLLYVTQYDQISVEGRAFTDYEYAFNPRFIIGGNYIEDITIDQKGIKLNDSIYNSSEINRIYGSKEPVTISVPIKNNTSANKQVEIEYEVYSWSDDLGKPEQKVITQEEILSKGTNISSYTIEDMKEAVYYVKVNVSEVGASSNIRWQSKAHIRFINKNISKPRIGFVGFNTAPYNPEGELSLISCLHNPNRLEVEGILENTIKNERGKIIANSEYRGKVTGQIDGIYTKLPKDKKYNKLLVTSTIKDKDGNILNSIYLTYDCKELDASKCEEENKSWLVQVGIGIGSLLVIVIILIFISKRRKNIIKF